MGKRLVYEIVTDDAEDARPVAVLFSNSSHPDQAPDEAFETHVREATGPTDLLARLVGETYLTQGGNHRQGDRLFSLVGSPYGDAEEVLRVEYASLVEDHGTAVVTRRPNEEGAPSLRP